MCIVVCAAVFKIFCIKFVVGVLLTHMNNHRDGDADFLEEGDSRSGSVSSHASSSVYSLIESAHPVFGRVKRLWHSPLESHREVCAVLAAVSEVRV